ncbi:11196_t:CDS:1, partial [Scutellospora calospora]
STNIDIDEWAYNLNKKYGQDGIFEFNMVGIRYIMINRAEYVSRFMLSEHDDHSKHLMRTKNNGLLDFYGLSTKGVAFNFDYNSWKFNRQLFARAMRTAYNSKKTAKLINNLFEEMINYWINLKNPDDDSTIIDASIWIFKYSFDSLSTIITGSPSFSMQSYYQGLKKIDTQEDIKSFEKYSNCLKHFQNDNLLTFTPKFLRYVPTLRGRILSLLNDVNFMKEMCMEKIRRRKKEIEKIVKIDPKQLGDDLLTSMIVANTPYETHPPTNVDPSLLRPMTDKEMIGLLFESYVPSET